MNYVHVYCYNYGKWVAVPAAVVVHIAIWDDKVGSWWSGWKPTEVCQNPNCFVL